jgi:hypothetical protein
MSRRTMLSLAVAAVVGIMCAATISSEAFAFRGGRVGVGRVGVGHVGGVYRGGFNRGVFYGNRGALGVPGVALGLGAAVLGAYGAYGSPYEYGTPYGYGYPASPYGYGYPYGGGSNCNYDRQGSCY